MENPSEGEHNQNHKSWQPQTQPGTEVDQFGGISPEVVAPQPEEHAAHAHFSTQPAPFVSHDTSGIYPTPSPHVPPEPMSGTFQNPAEPPHHTNAITIILQWLTYAFWGWTILVLSALTALVFARLLNSGGSSNANYYVISAAMVLLPISFVTDFFYSKKEPEKKVGAAMVVMVIHAVLFALFGIGALIFAVFSFVSLLVSSGSHTSTYVGLWSSILITIFYAATFVRTINPAKLTWVPKVYKISMIVVVLLFILFGFLKPHLGLTGPRLQPTAVGGAQCSIGDNYAQVAISGGATCTNAAAVIQDATQANGKNYKSNGYSCTATKQGSNTQWSSYYTGTFYSYSCADGGNQVAFNWQPLSADNSGGGSPPSTPTPTTTVTIGGPGALQPTLPGDGECDAATNYAQIAISGSATCTTAEAVVAAANGSNFSSNGYTCSATKEGSGSNTQWSSYWAGDFYAYTCSNGGSQIAFNWQTATESQ